MSQSGSRPPHADTAPRSKPPWRPAALKEPRRPAGRARSTPPARYWPASADRPPPSRPARWRTPADGAAKSRSKEDPAMPVEDTDGCEGASKIEITVDVAEELVKASALHAQGAIDHAEFLARRERLLDDPSAQESKDQ